VFSFEFDLSWKPSDHVRHLISVVKPDGPGPESGMDCSIEEACKLIDSEYVDPKIIKLLATYMRCDRTWLEQIHTNHRKNVLRISDARVEEIQKERAAARHAMFVECRKSELKKPRGGKPKPKKRQPVIPYPVSLFWSLYHDD
jgi:hypothetical protein